jgi:adenylosuccinate lyase
VSAKLRRKDLDALFDLGYHLKHVDLIFRRVFGIDRPARTGRGRKS